MAEPQSFIRFIHAHAHKINGYDYRATNEKKKDYQEYAQSQTKPNQSKCQVIVGEKINAVAPSNCRRIANKNGNKFDDGNKKTSSQYPFSCTRCRHRRNFSSSNFHRRNMPPHVCMPAYIFFQLFSSLFLFMLLFIFRCVCFELDLYEYFDTYFASISWTSTSEPENKQNIKPGAKLCRLR